MANLIPEIAKMLGVAVGEEFNIKGSSKRWTYKFDIHGLRVAYDGDTRMSDASANTFVALLNGETEIIKLPWEPRKGDIYFGFELLGSKWIVHPKWWGGFPSEYALLEKGWVFRTREEAKTALPSVAKESGMKYEL